MTTDNTAITIPIGRFTMDIPLNMKAAARSASIRDCELREIVWPTGIDSAATRISAWEKRLTEIQAMRVPRGEKQVIIEQKKLSDVGQGGHAVFYYGDGATNRMAFWDVLIDYNHSGLWIKSRARTELKESILNENIDIARAYKPISPHYDPPQKNWFFLEHGAIMLPYLEQEETYARFEGHPLDVKLEVKTTAVHKVSDSGLVDRLSASLAMNFAPGVDVDKLRTGKRTAAGLNGEEVIFRGTQNGESELSFTWLYTGQVDSGDAPKISIEMEASDGKVDEKLKLWDALLNSFKPIGR